MNWYFLAACVLGLSGCGGDPAEDAKRSPIINGEEYLISYVTKFVADAQTVGKSVKLRDMSISFGVTNATNPNMIGYCQHSAKGLFVVIDEAWFTKSSDDDREALMYHELGHCLLDLDHDSVCLIMNGSNCAKPRSIMYPQLISGAYGSDKTYYIEELFKDLP